VSFVDKIFKKPELTKEALFLQYVFSLLGKLVVADGLVSGEETSCVERFIHEALRLPAKKEKQALKDFKAAISSEEDFETIATSLKELVSADMLCLEMVLDILMQVSAADGEYSEDEEALVKKAAEIFDLNPNHLKHLKFRYSSGIKTEGLEPYYALLDCSSKASVDEINTTYGNLKKLYQAESLKSLGLPEEFLTYAKRRFERIEQAYKIIISEKA